VRLAVFPVQNAAGGSAPIRAISEDLEAWLAAKGLDVVSRHDLDEVLAKNRFRYTGGLDARTAKVLREDLGVGAVVIPTLEQYDDRKPPRLALALRIVEVSEAPVVLWADVVARTGDDSAGFLGLGLVDQMAGLEKEVIWAATAAVDHWARTRAPAVTCPADRRFLPRRSFRAPVLDDVGRRTIAVLPFANETSRRGADDVVAGEFIAQLARSTSFDVLDPGVVRDQLLEHRIVLEGGVSIDRAIALLELLNADLILSGEVHDYVVPAGARQTPSVAFTAYVIDRESGEVVWSSTSDGGGSDWVFLFGAGRVYSSSALSCRMVRAVVDGIAGQRGALPPYAGEPRPQQRLRPRDRAAQFQRQARDANQRELEQNGRGARAHGVNQAKTPQDQVSEEPSQ
jgi:TolB-like protein